MKDDLLKYIEEKAAEMRLDVRVVCDGYGGKIVVIK